MRHIIYFLSFIFFLPTFVLGEELFQVPWQEGKAQLQYQAGDDFDKKTGYYLGPQSLGVDGKENIYLLDNLHKRILIYSSQGNFLESITYQAPGCGLAVSPTGEIAIFSPSLKQITWINGERAGQSLDNFAALSQVWYQEGDWWAREGNRVKNLNTRTNSEMSFTFWENQVIVGKNSREESHFGWTPSAKIIQAWPLSSFDSNERLYFAAKLNSKNKSKTVVLRYELGGKTSNQVVLSRSFTQIFSPLAIGPQGYLYEMVTSKEGVSIYRHSELSQWENPHAFLPLSHPVLKEESALTEVDRDAPKTIRVFFRKENVVRTVKLQDYLKGVVSAEIYASWKLEAHRAMSVAARTYAVGRKRHSNADICTSTHCQAWTSNISPNARQAVDDTKDVLIYHNGRQISSAVYFAHCNGRTRNSEELWNYQPYLRSVVCACGHNKYYGHGVGACQWGLQTYALKGWNYRQIIQKYYTGTEVRK